MQPELKFLNDIAKPWDELNGLLAEQYAFQPDLSDVTSRVTALATAIKHQVDILAFDRNKIRPKKVQSEVDAESGAARLISDVSDAAKHGVLDTPARRNSIFVAAMFEVNLAGQYRFLRNGVFIEHASLGTHDFMKTALSAIEYWSTKRSLNHEWFGSVSEPNFEYASVAILKFNEKYCIQASSVRFKFFRRDDDGNFYPFSPHEVRIAIL